MNCIDFQYDGQLLSDYGCVICSIDTEPGVRTVNIGSQLVLNTVSTRNKSRIISSRYSEAYTTSFTIAKMNFDDEDDYVLSEHEISRIIKWLNRKEYHKFKIIYDTQAYGNVYYLGTFNVQVITSNCNAIGLELTLQTDSPFGYYEPIEYDIELDGSNSYVIHDISDETGSIYPEIVEIKCHSGGDLIITNSNDKKQTVIRNCVQNERITLYGETKQIVSDKTHERLYNDFNYNFVRIINKYENRMHNNHNVITSSIPCDIRLVYAPICKSGGYL